MCYFKETCKTCLKFKAQLKQVEQVIWVDYVHRFKDDLSVFPLTDLHISNSHDMAADLQQDLRKKKKKKLNYSIPTVIL